jgi:hypothetical protein
MVSAPKENTWEEKNSPVPQHARQRLEALILAETGEVEMRLLSPTTEELTRDKEAPDPELNVSADTPIFSVSTNYRPFFLFKDIIETRQTGKLLYGVVQQPILFLGLAKLPEQYRQTARSAFYK